jgi:hypothetical protein
MEWTISKWNSQSGWLFSDYNLYKEVSINYQIESISIELKLVFPMRAKTMTKD